MDAMRKVVGESYTGDFAHCPNVAFDYTPEEDIPFTVNINIDAQYSWQVMQALATSVVLVHEAICRHDGADVGAMAKAFLDVLGGLESGAGGSENPPEVKGIPF